MRCRLARLFYKVALVGAPAPAPGPSPSPSPPAPSPEPAPPPTPSGEGVVPASPYWLRVSGNTSGAKQFDWNAPTTLFGGLVFGDPVLTYRLRVRRADTGALVGSVIDVSAPTLTYTATGLPATTLRVTVSAINANGESEETNYVEWTGT